MPLYFFHLDQGQVYRDEIGTELDDLAAAKCHAVQFMAETLCHTPGRFWDAETCEVTAVDTKGLSLFSIAMIATMAPVAKTTAESL